MTNRREVLRALGVAGVGAVSVGLIESPLLARSSHTITMRNADPSKGLKTMAFSPDLLKVPKDTRITFAVESGAHNTQTTPGMVPQGAAGWRFGIRKSGTVTLSAPGFYGYHCLPHRAMGMVGLIIVEGPGMMDNLAAAKAVKHPGQAGARWQSLWTRAEALI